jgi:4-amino-4-deoxy-L-arabinose transferase-like glycosyltransferase
MQQSRPDSANKAEKGQENHDKPPAENWLPWIAQKAATSRSARWRLVVAIASTIRRKRLRL